MRREKKIPGGGISFVFPTTRCWPFWSVGILFAPDLISPSIGQNLLHVSPIK